MLSHMGRFAGARSPAAALLIYFDRQVCVNRYGPPPSDIPADTRTPFGFACAAAFLRLLSFYLYIYNERDCIQEDFVKNGDVLTPNIYFSWAAAF